MPEFTRNVFNDLYEASITIDFDAEFDIDCDDFYDAMDNDDKRRFAEWLSADGFDVHHPAISPEEMPTNQNPEALIAAFNDMPDQELFGMPDEYLDSLRSRLGVVPTQPTNTVLKSIIDGLEDGMTLNCALLNEMKLLA